MIDVRNFSCFDEPENPLITNASFTIHPRDRVCILSSHQERATILCHALAGTLKRTYPAHTSDGVITFREKSVFAIESHDRTEKIAYVPPNADLLISGVKETVFGEIALSLELAGMQPEQIREKVMSMLKKLDIEKLAGRDPDELSGGERHKIALASMIVREPAVLILDNPTMFLDVSGVKNLLTILRHYAGSIIIADPNPYAWASFASRFIVIQKNNVLFFDSPQDFIQAIDSEKIKCELPAWIELYRHVRQTLQSSDVPSTLTSRFYIRRIAGAIR